MQQQQPQQQQIDDNLNKSHFYDQNLYSNDIQSIIKLFIYLPFGLTLLVTRLSILSVLAVLLIAFPNLCENETFLSILTVTYGIVVSNNNKNNYNAKKLNKTNNNKIMIVSNHVTCFDYLVIKNVFKNLTLINNGGYESNDYLLNKILYFNQNIKYKNDVDDLTRVSQNSSEFILYFPENFKTNGKYALLNFNFDLLSTAMSDEPAASTIKYLPICLKVERKFLNQLSVNSNFNDYLSILLTLFTPLTQFDVKQLGLDEKLTNENVNEFAQRIQKKIGSDLGILCTNYTITDLLNKNNSSSNQRDDDLDIVNRLVRQVHDVLPNLSENIIRSHVRTSQTLDIDTIITSLLDLYSNMPPAPVVAKQVVTQQPSVKPVAPPKRYLSYQERKSALLCEARSRFLERENSC